MKRIRIVIIVIIFVFILTGCSATANVTVSKSGKVSEVVTIMEKNQKVIYGNNSLEDSVKIALAEYDTAIATKGYTAKVRVEDEESGVDVKNTHDDICDYIENTVFSQYLYKHINCVSDGNYYTIDSVGNYITRDTYYDTWNVPSVMTLKISLPFKATENNADSIKSNTYIWKYDSNTSASKTLHLKISKRLVEKAKIEYANEKKEESKKNTIKSIITTLIVILVAGIIGFIVYKIFYKKYKQNKIEY